jgi:hypothetical protein
MPRPSYPSDEARRKNKPAIRVHLSIANHPRYGSVFDDPEVRGMLVGLWVIAARAHVSKTGDVVSLSRGDIAWITGRAQHVHATRALNALCARMSYTMNARGERVEIHIRNFTRKQGFTPPTAERDSATPHPSESESDSASTPRSQSAENGHDPVEAAFEEFWAAKPAREGNSRAKAFASFVRAVEGYEEQIRGRKVSHPPAPPEVIIAGAHRWHEMTEKQGNAGTRFVPMASTWLNQRRWEDANEASTSEKPRVYA